MTWKLPTLTFAAAMLACTAAPISADEILPQTVPVQLDTSDPERLEIDGLVYLGGVELDTRDADIGGISSLEWHEEKLHAVMDDGRWLTMTTDELDDRLIDITALEHGPLLDERGKRLRGKEEADAEALAQSPDGGWLVAFEHDHRIWYYPTLGGHGQASDLPIVDLAFDADANNGLEALTLGPDGLLACGEWAGTDTMNCMRERGSGLVAYEVSPPQALAGRGAVPTDADCASNGTCYILFRSYSRAQGNAAAIVALSPQNEAVTVASLLPPLTLDNFEGLTVREQDGRTYLYLASDDNFSRNQRTLLMKFEVSGAHQEVELAPPPTNAPAANYETVNVVLETQLGDIFIALETERAPITAANFLQYVDEGRFDGTVFYRAMSLDRAPRPNGLIQGGTQFDPERILPGIQHEPTSETGLTHTSGALSMAMGEPGTANGDFSIMLQDQTGLDARPDSDDPVWRNGYAVFGYVTDGMDVVAAIHASPVDPDKGEGWMKGQMLAEPVTIMKARRAAAAE